MSESNAIQNIALVEAEQTRQQTLFTFGFISLILLVGMYVLYQRRKLAVLTAQNAQNLVERKNQMLSDVSHELRTPLAAIKLQVEMLEYKIAEDPQQTYAIVHGKIASLNRLINDVFQLAKADAGELDIQFNPVYVREWLEKTVETYEPLIRDAGLSVMLNVDFDYDLSLLADERRLSQVIENLISNSCRYTDTHGHIIISAHATSSHLFITVEDSAPGIQCEHLPQLFERLYRVDKSRSRESGGSGLGLSICKAMILEHDGKIRARHSELGGLKIEIKLPLNRVEEDTK